MTESRRIAGMIGRSLCLLAIAVGLIATIAGLVAGSVVVVVNGFILTAASVLMIGVVYCVVFARDASLHGEVNQ